MTVKNNSQRRKVTGAFAVFLVACVIGLLCLIKCSSKSAHERQDEKLEIDEVVRVFMHTPRHWSVLRREQDHQLRVVEFYNDEAPLIIDDVPDGEDMRLVLVPMKGGGSSYSSWEVHIHKASDVNGAGSDNGKFGHGQTQVIQ